MPLSPAQPVHDIPCGPIILRYVLNPQRGDLQFTLIPSSRAGETVARRTKVPLHPSLASNRGQFTSFDSEGHPDSLVQVALRGDEMANGFVAGHSMRNTSTTRSLRFQDQTVREDDQGVAVVTRLRSPSGIVAIHEAVWRRDLPGILIRCCVINQGDQPVVLEHVSSFCIGKLTPFAADDASGRLRLHRFQSAWSLEGRHEDRSIEDLHLERTWAGYGHVVLRYGQTGSQPVRGYFPFIALEDRTAGVLWGATLAWHGSWQMECWRREDPVVLAGGHADHDFGQWAKTLAPGDSFAAPPALVSCVSGDIDDLCAALVDTQEILAHPEPAAELTMPVVFNEWCSTWGNPTHDGVVATARALSNTPVGIFVIDDGWAKRPGSDFQTNGDWVVDPEKFPHGMRATADAIRAAGLCPGIWFEFEVVNRGNPLFGEEAHQLHRHGRVIQVGTRRFWDFRDEWTRNFLRERVIRFLRDNHFGYLKVDYNDSIGIGCDPVGDPAAGLGEGLRQHLQAVREFFLEIRRELPDLRIENCSSGGHRLEPGMVALTTMSSFSDAHECVEIPIIAANLLRLIPARKNQIWIVLRRSDTIQRLEYGFAATFLGRAVISGDLTAMSSEQRAVLDRALAFYQRIHPVIRDGVPRLYRSECGESYRYPQGRQAVIFHDAGRGEALLVAHAFAQPAHDPFRVKLPPGEWVVADRFGEVAGHIESSGHAVLDLCREFQAAALFLCLKKQMPSPSGGT